MTNKSVLIGCLCAAALLTTGLGFSQFSFNQNQKANLTAGKSVYKWEIDRLILELLNKDRPTITQGNNVLKANTIIYDEKKKTGYAYGRVYFRNAADGITLTAGEATYRTDEEKVIVTKSPFIRMDKNRVKASSWNMIIFPKKNLIILSGNVKITGENYEITGDKAVLNQDSGNFVITGNASTRQKDTVMVADKITIDSRNSQIENYTATGNVKITDPEKGFTIHSGKLEFWQHLGYSRITQDPWIDFKDKNIRAYSTVMEQYEKEDKANLLGNVIIVQGSRVAYSKWGEYRTGDKKIYLTGRPILKDGDSRFFAHRITVDIDKELMRMEGVGGGFYNLRTKPDEGGE